MNDSSSASLTWAVTWRRLASESPIPFPMNYMVGRFALKNPRALKGAFDELAILNFAASHRGKSQLLSLAFGRASRIHGLSF